MILRSAAAEYTHQKHTWIGVQVTLPFGRLSVQATAESSVARNVNEGMQMGLRIQSFSGLAT